MKRILLSSIAATALVGTLLVTSCDWSSGSDNNFNTSGSAQISNISGFYSGLFSGGRAVNNTSSGNITSLTIQQSGNRVDVIDNQGSRYTGNVGAPLVVTALSDGTIEAGALVATYQISWSGKDGVSARDIEFTGTINLVTVTDVAGNTDTSTAGSNTSNTTTSTSTTNQTTANPGQAGNFGQVEPGFTNVVTTTSTTTGGSNGSTTTTTTITYSLQDDSSQLRLRGTWVELGGRTSTVDAVAAGIDGNLSTSTTTGG